VGWWSSESCVSTSSALSYDGDVAPGELIHSMGGESVPLRSAGLRNRQVVAVEMIYFARPDSPLFSAESLTATPPHRMVLAKEIRGGGADIFRDSGFPIPAFQRRSVSPRQWHSYGHGLIKNRYVRPHLHPSPPKRAGGGYFASRSIPPDVLAEQAGGGDR